MKLAGFYDECSWLRIFARFHFWKSRNCRNVNKFFFYLSLYFKIWKFIFRQSESCGHFSRLRVGSLLVSCGDSNVWPGGLLQATVACSLPICVLPLQGMSCLMPIGYCRDGICKLPIKIKITARSGADQVWWSVDGSVDAQTTGVWIKSDRSIWPC